MTKNQTVKSYLLLKQENTFLKLEVKRHSENSVRRLLKANKYEEEIASLEVKIKILEDLLNDFYNDPEVWIVVKNYCKKIGFDINEEEEAKS